MRHNAAAGRRHRHRGHGNGNGGGNSHNNNNGNRRGSHNRMQVFDSNGPEVRIRGTAHQVVEKYLTMAKDAASAGDRVLEQSYLQHAEHYQRIISSFEEDVQNRTYNGASEPFIPAPNQRQEILPGERADLALPASILGPLPKAASQEDTQARVPEAVN